MDQIIEFYLSGIVLNSLCLFGLIANILTLYVLNASMEMRRQPINMFLTVLAIYDKGVLLNAILMCGIPALAKQQAISTSNNFIDDQNLFYNLTISNYDLNATELAAVFNRSSRSAVSFNYQNTLTNDQLQDNNQLWIDLISSKEDERFLIENQLIEDQLIANQTTNYPSNLLSLSNFNKSEILNYLNQSKAMAQQIKQQLYTNWTNSLNDLNGNLTLPINQPPSTFALMMQRLSNFFQGYIRIIYPLANISQTGSIWITCLITGKKDFRIFFFN